MPLRKCIGCGEFQETSQMIRVMKKHDSREVLINPDSNNFGRSSYLCYNNECMQNAIKKKRFAKTLKTEISANIIDKIKNLIENSQEKINDNKTS